MIRPGILRLYFSFTAMKAAWGPPNPMGTPNRCELPIATSAPISPGLNNIPDDEIKNRAEFSNMNFRYYDNGDVGIALDETVSPGDLSDILTVFKTEKSSRTNGFDLQDARANDFLPHSVFSNYHTETEMMRYLHRLETKDLTLNTSMISLGSCTMKLNAARRP